MTPGEDRQHSGRAGGTERPCAIKSTWKAIKITFFMQRDELKKTLFLTVFA
jgi:hypothetical protein